ncbi:hypothetical protein J2N86_11320 [Legionella lytica]|uniref:Uncharacterized protein n=1 Tax=Legionella lytica TaxID=96232 RepID=A0ABY4Y6L9_9GAMM|nr:hypothetical protein [Legionella lytica]USQ13271.1 hypothetical protein J2N86_11320 [Legionella lytica]
MKLRILLVSVFIGLFSSSNLLYAWGNYHHHHKRRHHHHHRIQPHYYPRPQVHVYQHYSANRYPSLHCHNNICE